MIENKDNAAIAKIIRNSLEEFNAVKKGTVYFDVSTDHLSKLFAPGTHKRWMLLMLIQLEKKLLR